MRRTSSTNISTRSSNICKLLALLAFSFLALIARAGPKLDTITLKTGERITGHLAGKSAGFALIELESETGVAERRVAPDSIARIEFADAHELKSATAASENQTASDAIAEIAPIAHRRAQYLGLLQPPDERALIRLAELYIADRQPLQALAYLKLWSEKLTDPANQQHANALLIRACLEAKLYKQATVFARRWIEEHPDPRYERSAIAWAVVAADELESGNPRNALWLALQPIACAHSRSTPRLDQCYRVAIEACVALGANSYANALEAERDNRPNPSKPDNNGLRERALLPNLNPHSKFRDLLVSNPQHNLATP